MDHPSEPNSGRHRTVVPANYDEYLEFEYPAASVDLAEARAADVRERQARLAAFPYCVVLQVSYPELDYANRWCWQQFGPANGECLQASSEYSACEIRGSHSHVGSWLTNWLVKTDYDFGFSEWYFAHEADRDRFLESVPLINWGEGWPK
ncbi:hypothetical protein D3870_20585 [Noviherbaspirillum cavernae]|uniref:Uncharacterized protein n=1 Tax=Noviherbaspirillum cavernae TaxID=2320862 RepID=A0A418WVR7_9BURK|nr:hypothetical protein D3870_20585 [Noviherbaspirillum cavernae]